MIDDRESLLVHARGLIAAMLDGENPSATAVGVLAQGVVDVCGGSLAEYEAAVAYFDALDRGDDDPELKDRLDVILAPHAENQAMVAFLERERLVAAARRERGECFACGQRSDGSE